MRRGWRLGGKEIDSFLRPGWENMNVMTIIIGYKECQRSMDDLEDEGMRKDQGEETGIPDSFGICNCSL